MAIDIADRFESKVRILPSGCWKWTGGKTKGGYGMIWRGPSKPTHVYTHIFSYERRYGTVPSGMDLDHLCRKRWCCNPDHLDPVTRLKNLQRGAVPTIMANMRGTCLKGHIQKRFGYFIKSGPNKGKYGYCRACRMGNR